jgi:archaellum component FlaC
MAGIDDTNHLLSDLLSEVSGLRADLVGMTSKIQIYDIDDIHDLLTDVRDKLEELTDAVTGSAGGIGGTSLEEVRSAVESLEATIKAKK